MSIPIENLLPQNRLSLLIKVNLKYWPLKYRIELCALRLSLHSSVQGLKTEIHNWSSNMSIQNNRYQAYLLWLQLFLTSH